MVRKAQKMGLMGADDEVYSYESSALYLLTIGPFDDEPLRCPIVHTAWGNGRCHLTIESAVELICKTCGRRTIQMCNGCVQWTIDYVAESEMGCMDQTPSHAVVAIVSIEPIPC